MSVACLHGADHAESSRRGSVLVIVLWVAFGLVSVALYFAQSMTLELKAADNRAAGMEAEQAIEGAARYAAKLLSTLETPGKLPDPSAYEREMVPVGDAEFWFLGRSDQQVKSVAPFFALVDESSKLNLNTATAAMLEALPRMTPELAASIIDWRDADSDATQNGAESDFYLRRSPAYNAKNAKFESIDELRLIQGADMEILLGEDTNQNGVLDANENDGNLSAPYDNKDGKLDPGILEFVTVHSRESNLRTNGSPRINIRQGGQQVIQQLGALLREKLSADRANAVIRGLGPAGAGFTSAIEFFIRSRMTTDEFALVASDITTTNGNVIEGLINVNTASQEVLACIPGIGTDKAPSLVSYRISNPDKLTSVAWIVEVLGQQSAIQAGPYITGRSAVFSADIAAVGHHGRGYRRARFIFDLTEGSPRVVYRQDLGHLGWAMGWDARQEVNLLAERGRNR